MKTILLAGMMAGIGLAVIGAVYAVHGGDVSLELTCSPRTETDDGRTWTYYVADYTATNNSPFVKRYSAWIGLVDPNGDFYTYPPPHNDTPVYTGHMVLSAIQPGQVITGYTDISTYRAEQEGYPSIAPGSSCAVIHDGFAHSGESALLEPNLIILNDKITALEVGNANLKSEISGLKTQISNMTDIMSDLSARLAALESRTQPPEPISDLRATLEPDPDHIRLTWTGPNNQFYTIRQSTSSPDGPWTVTYETRVNLMIVQHPDPGTTYYFQVRGGGSWSNTASVTTPSLESTGVMGKIYTDANNNGVLDLGEQGRVGIEVITVSLANHSDVNRLRSNANGNYSFELDAGGYLVQAIGGGPNSYAYLNIPDGTMLMQNLAY